jgi:hypothetical protein
MILSIALDLEIREDKKFSPVQEQFFPHQAKNHVHLVYAERMQLCTLAVHFFPLEHV